MRRGLLHYTSGAKAIDNGARRKMFTYSADMIGRFTFPPRPARDGAPSFNLPPGACVLHAPGGCPGSPNATSLYYSGIANL